MKVNTNMKVNGQECEHRHESEWSRMWTQSWKQPIENVNTIMKVNTKQKSEHNHESENSKKCEHSRESENT